MSTITVVGIPTSAGTHNAGIERAPEQLRAAGLIDKLRGAGAVLDTGDLPRTPYRPMGIGVPYRDGDRVIDVDRTVAARVADMIATTDTFLLAVGGDCTVTLGVVAGLLTRFPDLGLLYFDGDVDLSTPDDTENGILDTMVSTHLLGLADTPLSRLGPRFPLLDSRDIVYFGYHPLELAPTHDQWLQAQSVGRFPVTSFQGRPVEAARRAVAALNDRPVLIHFDADVIDSGDAPLSNFPHFNGGLTMGEAFACLSVFLTTTRPVGLVLTEINPDHDPDGKLLDTYVEQLVQTLRSVQSRNDA